MRSLLRLGVAAAGIATGVLVGSYPAAADESDRFVGSSCQQLTAGFENTWQICDQQYDSMNLPGYRSHVLVATPTNGCPVLTQTVRLRAGIESYEIPGMSASYEATGEFCPELRLTASGSAASTVNVSVDHVGSGDVPRNVVFAPQ